MVAVGAMDDGRDGRNDRDDWWDLALTAKELDDLLSSLTKAVLRPDMPPPRTTTDVAGPNVDALLGSGRHPSFTHEHWPSRDACRICNEGRYR